MKLLLQVPLILCLVVSTGASRAAEVTIAIDPEQTVKRIDPGAVGWGAMWKQQMIYPAPGKIKSDDDHKVYIEHLARTGSSLAKQADLRNISDEKVVRGNAVRAPDGKLYLYGGNFSMDQQHLRIAGVGSGNATAEYMSDTSVQKTPWDMGTPLVLPPMTLWRIVLP